MVLYPGFISQLTLLSETSHFIITRGEPTNKQNKKTYVSLIFGRNCLLCSCHLFLDGGSLGEEEVVGGWLMEAENRLCLLVFVGV